MKTEAPPKPRTRARSPEAKEKARASIIEAGRRAFSMQDFEKVSLRGIAAAAQVSPSVIYGYFEDRQALFLAIREEDLNDAVGIFEQSLEGLTDPAERLRTLFLVATEYWRNHLDQYEVLYAKPLRRQTPRYADGSMFGASSIARRSHGVWEKAVEDFLKGTSTPQITVKLATECLEVAMHGVVSIPPRQLSRRWSRSEDMARLLIESLIQAWR
ncbi:TetR/AcrR family transcriptional regulator [Variovorax sp. VNK109]|uniref:TetR/AcrR family transcriptional regulator n=1 Tax=Variovorax sp. VNK109 TaxID=3400919 RepID=UPI003C0CFF96